MSLAKVFPTLVNTTKHKWERMFLSLLKALGYFIYPLLYTRKTCNFTWQPPSRYQDAFASLAWLLLQVFNRLDASWLSRFLSTSSMQVVSTPSSKSANISNLMKPTTDNKLTSSMWCVWLCINIKFNKIPARSTSLLSSQPHCNLCQARGKLP